MLRKNSAPPKSSSFDTEKQIRQLLSPVGLGPTQAQSRQGRALGEHFLINSDIACDVMFSSAVGLHPGAVWHRGPGLCTDLVCSFQNKVHPPLLLCPLPLQGSGSLAP